MSRLTNSNEVEQLSSRFAHLDSQSALAAPDTGDFTNLSVNSSGRRRRRRRNKSKPNENIKDQIPRSSSIGQGRCYVVMYFVLLPHF
ncbi:hypothetical protein D915_010833 [Fasciola hepatica]|uniref:Uncharacterized protein n=1 Tax=Fasciola hepatica TaxID=6192 RepID=A0A4E0R901_FASHE|nr:hypothetical protein D915_010833 [Fasciola hepatica]